MVLGHATTQPPVPRGADLPCPGAAGNRPHRAWPACGHKSEESASLPGRELWEAPSCQPHLQPSSGPLFRVAQPRSLLQLPVSWAPHSRPGCLAAFRGESSCLGPVGRGRAGFTVRPGAGFRAKSHCGALVLTVALVILGGLSAWTSLALCPGLVPGWTEHLP